MNEIALLGGSFDPISLHHEKICKTIFETTGMPTWVMPCWHHRFDKGTRLVKAKDRWEMVQLAADQKWEWMFPFGWEIALKHNGSMFQTIAKLKKVYPNHRFHIVIGMDNANVIEEQWNEGKTLIQENPFIVLERNGVIPATDWFTKSPHRVFPLDSDLSSTVIRDAIANGNYEFAKQHLALNVWKYIQEKGLYGYKV